MSRAYANATATRGGEGESRGDVLLLARGHDGQSVAQVSRRPPPSPHLVESPRLEDAVPVRKQTEEGNGPRVA